MGIYRPGFNSESSSGGGSVPQTTPLTLYVSNSGSDSNPGTDPAFPLLTLQAAVDKVPKVIKNAVKISMAAGSYAGAFVSGFQTLQPLAPSTDLSYLWIEGTMSNVTPATGPGSGTLTAYSQQSNATLAVMTDSTQSWTVNDLVGKYVKITSGTGSTGSVSVPPIYLIVSNTSTALTVLGTNAQAGVGSGYQIVTCGTVFTSPCATLPVSTTAPMAISAPTASCLTFFANQGLGYAVSQIACTVATGNTRGIVTADSRLRFFIVQLNGGTGALSGFLGQAGMTAGGVLITQTYASGFPTGTNSGCVQYSNTGGGASQAGPQVTSSMFSNSGTGIITSSPNGVQVSNCQFTSCSSAGILMTGNSGPTQVVNSRFSACASAILMSATTSIGLAPSTIGLNQCDISSCTTAGINIPDRGQTVNMDNVTGSGNAIGLLLAKGAAAKVGTGVSMTGTVEVSIDGASSTYALMRDAVPKLIADTYGTIFYE